MPSHALKRGTVALSLSANVTNRVFFAAGTSYQNKNASSSTEPTHGGVRTASYELAYLQLATRVSEKVHFFLFFSKKLVFQNEKNLKERPPLNLFRHLASRYPITKENCARCASRQKEDVTFLDADRLYVQRIPHVQVYLLDGPFFSFSFSFFIFEKSRGREGSGG
jgi:hypothetical protein